jgi:hypothetical protein
MLDVDGDGRKRCELLKGDEARRSRHDRDSKLAVRLWGGLASAVGADQFMCGRVRPDESANESAADVSRT